MRILVVTPTVPWPPNWGFGIRVYQFVRLLARNNEVSVLCYAKPGDEDKAANLARDCHAVHTCPYPLPTHRDKRLAQLTSIVRRTSFQTSSLRTAALTARAAELLASEPFDLVQFESSQMSALPLPAGVPMVVDEHNIEYELLHRMFRTERSPLRKLFNWSEYRKFAREERAGWERADGCVVTSGREREIVGQRVPAQLVHVAPNGVDLDFFAPADAPPEVDEIVFTGILNYRPNTDAVTFFARQVLPLIVERRPRARFVVVGLDPPEEIRRLAGEHVDVVGEVPDVRPYVRRAAVVAVPLRMGSGTRLKILEALAMGKGMVSTTVGCEGIDVRDGEHLLVADGPAAFARAVVSLMENADLAGRLGRCGRSMVEERYSWVSIVEGLEDFHRRLLDGRAVSRPSSSPYQ